MKKFLLFLVVSTAASGCMTTHSEGFVNYKAMGDVYGTKPQAVDYEEVGTMKAGASGFVWSSCDEICKHAVVDLKDKAKDRGGDSLIDVSYERDQTPTKTPTCSVAWRWWDLALLPILSPWKKECSVEGVAVARSGAKALHNQAQRNQATPTAPVQININNTQNNGAAPAQTPVH